MTNPYESPHESTEDRPGPSTPLLTRPRVFWFGLAAIIVALMMLTGSHVLFVESRRANGAWDTIVFIIDGIAGLVFLSGVITLAVYHWFPDPRRR